jgi:hypothetical protein
MANDDPKALITGFRLSHQMLTDSISQIQLSLRSYSQAKPKLRELYSNLHNHFSRQDQKLYERLSIFYAEDRPTTKMLEFLAHDLKDFKIKYLVFSDQHTGEMGGGHPRSFPAEFIEFANSILARIKIEEDYLFPLLEKLPPRAEKY